MGSFHDRALAVASFLLLSSSTSFAAPNPTIAGKANVADTTGIAAPTLITDDTAVAYAIQRLYPHSPIRSEPFCRADSRSFTSSNLRELSEPQIDRGSSHFIYRPERRSLIELSVLDSPIPNAFARKADADEPVDAKIFITIGLLDEVRDEAQLAFVIAHEVAHIDLDYLPPPLPLAMLTAEQLSHIATVHQSWELEADQVALKQLREVGYSENAPIALFDSLTSFESIHAEPLAVHAPNHPPLKSRSAAMKLAAKERF